MALGGSAAVPGAGARDGSRRPRARPPVAGRLRSSSGPARAVRGPRRGAARRGEGPPGPDAAGGTRQATARRGAQVTRGPPLPGPRRPRPFPAPGRAPAAAGASAGPARLGWVAPRAPPAPRARPRVPGPQLRSQLGAPFPGTRAPFAPPLFVVREEFGRGPGRRVGPPGVRCVPGAPGPSVLVPFPPNQVFVFSLSPLSLPGCVLSVYVCSFDLFTFWVLWVMAACGKHS